MDYCRGQQTVQQGAHTKEDALKPSGVKRLICCLALLGLKSSLPAGAEPLLEGRVSLPSGAPAPNAQVMLFDLTDLRQMAATTTDEAGSFSLSPPGLHAASPLPERFSLGQNYPNPFNPSTTIPYQLPVSAHVRLEVFNLLGQRIAALVDGDQPAGFQSARWDGTDAAGRAVGAGVYLYRLQSGSMVATQRMVLIDGQAGVPAPEGIPGGGAASGAEPLAMGTTVYGLTVSAPGLVTYVDPAFEVQAGMGPLDLQLAEPGGLPRGKAAATGLLGDVDNNGRVDIVDALLVATYIADNSITMPNNGDISQGDLNSDGRIDYIDVWLIVTEYVLSQIGTSGTPTADSSKIYWTAERPARIQRASLDGSNVEDLVTTGLINPRGLELDVSAGRVYWIDAGTDKIQRADLDGANVEDLVTAGLAHPLSLALDVAAGKMYWVDSSTEKIQRASLDGSNVEDLVTSGVRRPEGMALDIAAGKMYWLSASTDKIQRANLDGSSVEDLVTVGLSAPSALALDQAAGKMYWTDSGTDKIQRANLDGSQVEDLVTTGLLQPEELELDVASGKMYWADWITGKVQRANLDGSQVENLVTGRTNAYGLALDISMPGEAAPVAATLSPDPSTVDFINDGTWHALTVQASESVVVVVNPSGATPRLESTGTSGAANQCPAESQDSLTREDGQAIYLSGCSAGQAKVELRRASDQTLLRTYTFTIEEIPTATTGPGIAKIYWTNGDKIQRAGPDGSNVEDLVTFGSPRGVAVDALGGKIYWSDQDTRWIWRANLDGSDSEAVITARLIRPVAIALDLGRGQIYWTDAGSNKIQRANLDGSRVETLVSIGLHSPEGLALDVDGGKVYWSDYGTNKIQRANLDGSNVEDLITTGLRIPGELALDSGAGKIYWTDYGTDKIQRADLDGSNIEDLVTTGLRIAKGLALDVAEGKIYWADSGTGQVRRANLDGSNVEDLVTLPSAPPTGLDLANSFASLSPNLASLTLPRGGSWRRFEVHATEPILLVANPTGSPARVLVAGSQGETTQCPAKAEATITRYHGQSVYLAACEPGEARLELRRAADQTVLRTYTFKVSLLSKMYWIDAGSNKIQRANLDGSNIEDLVTTGLGRPIDIALDVSDGRMYWTDHQADKIKRADLDGSNIRDIITTGLRYPVGLALDLTAAKMYWTDLNTDRIQRADLDGSNLEVLVTGLGTPRGLALNVGAGQMYWADQDPDAIKRANFDGSNIEDLVASGLDNPDRLALDLLGNRVYWTDSRSAKIMRATLGGSNVQNLVLGLGEPRGLALDLSAEKMYWTDIGSGKIQRANLDGSNVEDLLTGLRIPVAIALE